MKKYLQMATLAIVLGLATPQASALDLFGKSAQAGAAGIALVGQLATIVPQLAATSTVLKNELQNLKGKTMKAQKLQSLLVINAELSKVLTNLNTIIIGVSGIVDAVGKDRDKKNMALVKQNLQTIVNNYASISAALQSFGPLLIGQ